MTKDMARAEDGAQRREGGRPHRTSLRNECSVSNCCSERMVRLRALPFTSDPSISRSRLVSSLEKVVTCRVRERRLFAHLRGQIREPGMTSQCLLRPARCCWHRRTDRSHGRVSTREECWAERNPGAEAAAGDNPSRRRSFLPRLGASSCFGPYGKSSCPLGLNTDSLSSLVPCRPLSDGILRRQWAALR